MTHTVEPSAASSDLSTHADAKGFEVTIRDATPKDRDIVVSMFRDMLQHAFDCGSALNLEPTAKNAGHYFDILILPGILAGDPVLIAEVDGQPVAIHVCCEVRGTFDLVRRTALAHGLFVRPDYRRRGIARRLHEHANARLRAMGVPYLDGVTDIENPGGARSAESNGMRTVGFMVRTKL